MRALPPGLVGAGYRHVDKMAVPAGVRGSMKWYELREEGRVLDPAVRDAAGRVVDGLIDPGDVGFVIQHLCGDDVTLLLVCRWRNDNEIWETVFAQRGSGEFAGVGDDDLTRASYCVWELGIVNSERLAWAAFLRSSRNESELDAYLGAFCAGVI